jgi:hypothetical protein
MKPVREAKAPTWAVAPLMMMMTPFQKLDLLLSSGKKGGEQKP